MLDARTAVRAEDQEVGAKVRPFLQNRLMDTSGFVHTQVEAHARRHVCAHPAQIAEQALPRFRRKHQRRSVHRRQIAEDIQYREARTIAMRDGRSMVERVLRDVREIDRAENVSEA